MIDIYKILYEVCENECVYEPDCELLESGVLDSLAFIELFARLEDEGVEIQPTRIDRKRLSTPAEIEKLVKEYIEKSTPPM